MRLTTEMCQSVKKSTLQKKRKKDERPNEEEEEKVEPCDESEIASFYVVS